MDAKLKLLYGLDEAKRISGLSWKEIASRTGISQQSLNFLLSRDDGKLSRCRQVAWGAGVRLEFFIAKTGLSFDERSDMAVWMKNMESAQSLGSNFTFMDVFKDMLYGESLKDVVERAGLVYSSVLEAYSLGDMQVSWADRIAKAAGMYLYQFCLQDDDPGQGQPCPFTRRK